MLRFPCPKCAKVLSVQESQAGAAARCPACGQKFRIPTPATKPTAVKKPPPKAAVEEEAAEYEVVEEEAQQEDADFEVADEPEGEEAAEPAAEEEAVPRKKKKKKKKKQKAEVPAGQLFPWISNMHLGLLVVCVGGLFTCSCCLFFGWNWYNAKEQLEDPEVAIAALTAKGAAIKRDEKLPDKPVVEVTMVGEQFTDSDVKHLRAFTQLRKLQLAHAPVHNHSTAHLKDLKNLQYLDLSYTDISDGGMEDLEGLTNLEEVSLASLTVTDAGLSHLKGCTKLKKLHLENTPLASGRELEHAIPGLVVTK